MHTKIPNQTLNDEYIENAINTKETGHNKLLFFIFLMFQPIPQGYFNFFHQYINIKLLIT